MAGFSEWLVLESFLEGLETEMLLERAALETLSMVARAIRENEEEDDDGPAVLDDPFSGDEDASPKWEAPKKANPEQDPAPEKESKPTSGYVDASKNSADLERIAKAIKTIRAGAIRARAEKVKEIARLADSGADMEAIPLLAELGYFGKTDEEGQNETVRKINYYLGGEFRKEVVEKSGGRLDQKAKDTIREKENEFHDKLMKALDSAANEEGNDPPEEGFPSQDEVKQATDNFMISLNSLMGSRFESLARGNQKKIGSRLGHKHYEEGDIASEMVLGLINFFKKRRWEGSGDNKTLLPWGHDDDLLKSNPIGFLMTTAKNQTKKIKAKASPPVKFSVPNGSAKASVIRKDLDNKDFGFYLAYIQAAKDSPLRTPGEGQDEDVIRDKDEKIILPRANFEKEDKLRIRIMKDIEIAADSGVPGMSMNPDDIENTLENYLQTKLVPQYRQVIPASQLAGDDESSEDEVLSGMSHSQHSDDEFDPRTANPIDIARADDQDDGEEPEQAKSDAQAVRTDQMMLDLFRQVVDELSAKGGVYPARAFALCLKYNIKCRITTTQGRTQKGQPTTTVASVKVADDATINIPQGTNFNFDSASNCTGQFTKIGMANINVSRRWGFMPVTAQPSGLTPISPSQAGELLMGNSSGTGAIPYLCQKLRNMGLRR